jgi:hypothetical protein
VIKPTVGRVVWYRRKGENADAASQPYAAIVTFVHSDTCVNLVWFDSNSRPQGSTSVPLRQDGEAAWANEYCEWMPYQLGQAAKTEQLQTQLGEGK